MNKAQNVDLSYVNKYLEIFARIKQKMTLAVILA